MRTCAGLEPIPGLPFAPQAIPWQGEAPASIQLAETAPARDGSSSGRPMQRHTRAGKRRVQHMQRSRPHVVLVNRRFTAGRSILRLDEVRPAGCFMNDTESCAVNFDIMQMFAQHGQAQAQWNILRLGKAALGGA